jgi:hypothetical protein
MELTEEEQDLYTKSKTEYEAKISEHTKQKEDFIKKGDYEKAKKENQIVENLRQELQNIELRKIETLQNKKISKLNFNYEELLKQTKDKYEIKLKTAEIKYDQNLAKLKHKRKQELREVEIKYAYQKKHSPEYKAMQEEEKKLLANNRFDEAIALQKLRRKKEEEDNIRYRMIHRNEMETLKKNVNNTYNKEFTNFQNRKNNEIEMIKKEMNIALDNLDKQFNKKRHDLIVRDNNNNLIKTNKPLAKSRLFTNQSLILNQNDRNNIKRIFSPNNINVRNRTKVSLKKPKLNSKGKRKKSANVNTKKK